MEERWEEVFVKKDPGDETASDKIDTFLPTLVAPHLTPVTMLVLLKVVVSK